MLIVGLIIIFIVLFTIIIYGILEEDTVDTLLFGVIVGMVLTLGISLIVSSQSVDDPIELKASENTMQRNITTHIINDKIVSSDTIYIFTPKLNK